MDGFVCGMAGRQIGGRADGWVGSQTGRQVGRHLGR